MPRVRIDCWSDHDFNSGETIYETMHDEVVNLRGFRLGSIGMGSAESDRAATNAIRRATYRADFGVAHRISASALHRQTAGPRRSFSPYLEVDQWLPSSRGGT